MRTIGASLQTRLNLGHVTLCRIFTITRTDGTIYRYTDLDRNVTFSGNTYYADNSISIANITASAGSSGLNTTNARFIFDAASGIDPLDVARGRFDNAQVKISWIDYEYPSYGEIVLLVGYISVLTLTNKENGDLELRGLLNQADARIGQFYRPECDADLGDSRCTVDLTSLTQTGTITAVTTRTKLQATLTGSPADNYFAFGVLTWTSGDNLNYSMEVLSQVDVGGGVDQIVLALEMPDVPQVGDTFEIVAGCDKRLSTCISKFNNVANFRGYPFVPGSDAIVPPVIG